MNERSAEHLEEHGFCVLPGVLDLSEVKRVRERLVAAAEESERRGISTYIAGLDPNESNVRVFNLLDLDPIFIELIQHPVADDAVTEIVGPNYIISNFTANIARPGSGSMMVHSDLGIVLPEPWHSPWSVNVIWCLDDVREENGATKYLPGSHRYQRASELPDNPLAHMVSFEADAGSVIVMEGRLWHTSGENTSESHERALLFGYYSCAFIRPQWNFNVGLSEETKSTLSPTLKSRLGLDLVANIAQAN